MIKMRAPKDVAFTMRMSAEDMAAFRAAAERADMSLSDWIRRTCRAALAPEPKRKR